MAHTVAHSANEALGLMISSPPGTHRVIEQFANSRLDMSLCALGWGITWLYSQGPNEKMQTA